MSKPNEIKVLTQIAAPDIALITTVGPAHLEFFPDIEAIAYAKAEILSSPDTKLAILSSALRSFRAFQNLSLPTVFYSSSDSADYQLCKAGDLYYIRDPIEDSPLFSLPFTAQHLIDNCLAAIAAARELKLHWQEILPQLSTLAPYAKRFRLEEYKGITFINDSYNANPLSVEAALRNLPPPKPGGKKIAVLAPMKELGSASLEYHKKVGYTALETVDLLLCFGEEYRPLIPVFSNAQKPLLHFPDRSSLEKELFNHLESADIVLIKGSNSYKMWELLV